MTTYPASLTDRVIRINSPIDPDTARLVMAGLMFFDMDKPGQPITVVLESPGGTVYDGLTVYDVMRRVRSPLYTLGIGMVGGFSALLLAAGNRGCRYLMPGASVALTGLASNDMHNPILSREIKRLADIIAVCYGQCTSMSADNQTRWTGQLMPPEAAIQLGIADHHLSEIPPGLG